MAGSVILAAMESGAEQEQSHGTLPMVVWLRGDEEDFTLSAEDVMAALDIKRSRLTQISGRELRVGRRRVDRYLKPFYRPADVYSYQESTRAAVTRQRSAAAVSSVADDIEARHKTLLQDTTAQLSSLVANTGQALQQNLSTLLLKTQHKTSLTLTENNFLQTQKILSGIQALVRHCHTLLAEFEQRAVALQDSAVQQLRDILRPQQQALETLQNNSVTQREEIEASNAAHTAQLLALQQGSDGIVQQLRDVTARHETELQTLRDSLHKKINSLEQLIVDNIAQELSALRQAVTDIPAPQPLPQKFRVWASLSP